MRLKDKLKSNVDVIAMNNARVFAVRESRNEETMQGKDIRFRLSSWAKPANPSGSTQNRVVHERNGTKSGE
jgi:hypothetical protein